VTIDGNGDPLSSDIAAGEARYSSNFGWLVSGTLYGHHYEPTFYSSLDAYFNWRTDIAALPSSKAYRQFLKFSRYGGHIDPNAEYMVQGQRRGFTINYQVQDPDATAYALSASLPKSFKDDPYGGHGGNWSQYGGNFLLNTFHYVSVSTIYAQGQWVGGEFHSDFFGPLGFFLPLHGIDAAASYIIPNSGWSQFQCSINSGCN
jgi:hypothetical protein